MSGETTPGLPRGEWILRVLPALLVVGGLLLPGAAGEPVSESPGVEGEVQFGIYVDGERWDFPPPPANVQGANLAAGDDTRVLLASENVTFGGFLGGLDWNVTGDCVTSNEGDRFCVGPGGDALRAFLNGVEVSVGAVDRHVMRDGDRIALVYQTPAVPGDALRTPFTIQGTSATVAGAGLVLWVTIARGRRDPLQVSSDEGAPSVASGEPDPTAAWSPGFIYVLGGATVVLLGVAILAYASTSLQPGMPAPVPVTAEEGDFAYVSYVHVAGELGDPTAPSSGNVLLQAGGPSGRGEIPPGWPNASLDPTVLPEGAGRALLGKTAGDPITFTTVVTLAEGNDTTPPRYDVVTYEIDVQFILPAPDDPDTKPAGGSSPARRGEP